MGRVGWPISFRFKRIFNCSHAYIRSVDSKMRSYRADIDQKKAPILSERLPNGLANGSNLLLNGPKEEFMPVDG
jgi:hypothetical protein